MGISGNAVWKQRRCNHSADPVNWVVRAPTQHPRWLIELGVHCAVRSELLFRCIKTAMFPNISGSRRQQGGSFALAMGEQVKHHKRNNKRANRIRKRPAGSKRGPLPDIRQSDAAPNPIGSANAYYTFLCKALPKAPRTKPMGTEKGAMTRRIPRSCAKGFGSTMHALQSFAAAYDVAGSSYDDLVEDDGADGVAQKEDSSIAPDNIRPRRARRDAGRKTLSDDWKQHWDAEEKAYYFHNECTGVTQWNHPSKLIGSSNMTVHQRPFEGPVSLWPSSEKSGPNISQKRQLDRTERKRWTVGRQTLGIWLRKQAHLDMIRNWRLNIASHLMGAVELMAALRAAKNLASLRIVAFRWRNFAIANATRRFFKNFQKWKHKYARFSKTANKSVNAALTGPEEETKKMMLMIRNQCFTGSQAATLTQKKFREKVANSNLIPLSQFGNWLLAHGGYAWKQYRRGKADEENIYKMADVERALVGWITDKAVTEKLQQRARARLVAARLPAHSWPRIALVLARGYWATALAWWNEKKLEQPDIETKIEFTGVNLANALWACLQASDACGALMRTVHHVMFAAHVNSVGVGCFKLKQKRKLTKKEIVEARVMFDTYDLDCSGAIELVELHNGLMAMGFNVKLEQVKALLDAVDDDETGEIEFLEFVQLLESMPGLPTSTEGNEGKSANHADRFLDKKKFQGVKLSVDFSSCGK